jgi:hypothetical protein
MINLGTLVASRGRQRPQAFAKQPEPSGRFRSRLALLLVPLTLAVRPDQAPAPADLVRGERVVFVASNLADEELVACSAAVVAVNPSAVMLLDTPRAAQANRRFLDAYKPAAIVPIGPHTRGRPRPVEPVARRLGRVMAPMVEMDGGAPAGFFARAERVVVCPARPRRQLLHAACLAGALRAPLVLTHPGEGAAGLRERLAHWQTKKVYAISSAAELGRDLGDTEVVPLATEAALTDLYLAQIMLDGPVHTIVLANPADVRRHQGKMSALAPWLAVKKRAALALTDDDGRHSAAVVRAILGRTGVKADTLLIAATLKAIPTERRPNPVKGKDEEIEMEPLTPKGAATFTFATGRLFHEDPAIVLLQQAREKLLQGPPRARKALVISNPGGGLPLLETFSRHTARELRNAGYQTTAAFHDDVQKEAVRRALPDQDIFLWEGHYKTLTEEFGFLTWDEPLRPSLVFLQSCLALKEEEAGPVIERGAVAVVGSSTRTYSGTGGAFTLAYFDALVYDGQTLGGALRQAKNFLLCYSLLKEKRLGAKALLKGVNIRSSWAFSLWGDPTLKLPLPEPPADRLAGVQPRVREDRITIILPDTTYDTVKVGRYEASMRPNARLAGLLRISDEGEDERTLVPFVFAEVHFKGAVPSGVRPHLRSRIPSRNWVFRWDPVRRCGYLLITPRAKDEGELKFSATWQELEEAAGGGLE